MNDLNFDDTLRISGCGGNINNYETIAECRAVAVVGACCFRKYSLKVEDVVVASQQKTHGCKVQKH